MFGHGHPLPALGPPLLGEAFGSTLLLLHPAALQRGVLGPLLSLLFFLSLLLGQGLGDDGLQFVQGGVSRQVPAEHQAGRGERDKDTSL